MIQSRNNVIVTRGGCPCSTRRTSTSAPSARRRKPPHYTCNRTLVGWRSPHSCRFLLASARRQFIRTVLEHSAASPCASPIPARSSDRSSRYRSWSFGNRTFGVDAVSPLHRIAPSIRRRGSERRSHVIVPRRSRTRGAAELLRTPPFPSSGSCRGPTRSRAVDQGRLCPRAQSQGLRSCGPPVLCIPDLAEERLLRVPGGKGTCPPSPGQGRLIATIGEDCSRTLPKGNRTDGLTLFHLGLRGIYARRTRGRRTGRRTNSIDLLLTRDVVHLLMKARPGAPFYCVFWW